MPSILLKGGTVIIHYEGDNIKASRVDVLIKENRITEIKEDLSADSADTEMIDCTGKIICPGFIDTHHHLWQTQLKGRHADHTLIDYFPTGNFQSSNYTTSDFFWGQLGGTLEAINAGTTTIVDHAHVAVTPHAAQSALSATISSGVRSVFGYTPITRVASWNPLTVHQNIFEPWVMETFASIAKHAPYGNGRVQLGFAFDLYFLPKEFVQSLFSQVKELGAKLITSHCMRNPQAGTSSLPELLNSYGLLNDFILLSHGNGSSASDASLIKANGAHLSSTPSTELQMGMGQPVCFHEPMSEIHSQCSLGIDCHSNNSASIPIEMRLALQNARAVRAQRFLDVQKAPKQTKPSVNEAFNLGTIYGARAINMEDQIGSIAVGKLADLVILDATSPAMVCAADHDPVAAVVLHSSPADIDMVIIDGVVKKKAGKLLAVEVEKSAVGLAGSSKLEWKAVARELIRSRRAIQEKIDKLDFVDAREKLMGIWQLDPSKIVDEV